MAQGLIGGATSYEEQSLQDIIEDINSWIVYTRKTQAFLIEQMEIMQKTKYINKIPYGFTATMHTTITYMNTILHDFQIITKAIQSNCITEKEVSLIAKIGRKSNDFNREYGQTYREDTRYWHDYGNPDFKVVEEFYKKGRDYFVTLQDAVNVSYRLEDYVVKGQITNQSITFGDYTKDIAIQQGNHNVMEHVNISNSFDYEKALKVLKEIEEYFNFPQFGTTFEENTENVKNIVLTTISAIEHKEDATLITKSLKIIKDLAIGATGSMISSGILTLLGTLPL